MGSGSYGGEGGVTWWKENVRAGEWACESEIGRRRRCDMGKRACQGRGGDMGQGRRRECNTRKGDYVRAGEGVWGKVYSIPYMYMYRPNTFLYHT